MLCPPVQVIVSIILGTTALLWVPCTARYLPGHPTPRRGAHACRAMACWFGAERNIQINTPSGVAQLFFCLRPQCPPCSLYIDTRSPARWASAPSLHLQQSSLPCPALPSIHSFTALYCTVPLQCRDCTLYNLAALRVRPPAVSHLCSVAQHSWNVKSTFPAHLIPSTLSLAAN